MIGELNTPVVLVIFNRPDLTQIVFEHIKKVKPKKLYIIADGPRDSVSEDEILCKKCRDIVADIDWDCKVFRNYSDVNMGCGRRPASGFDWVFEQEESAIILEDDCVPSTDFFYFCEELLRKYWDDKRIFSISGMNFGYSCDNNADYFFTVFNNTCGWATWKRVWKQYDYEIKEYPRYRDSKRLEKLLLNQDHIQYWYNIFEYGYLGKETTAWDYQFLFLSFLNNGLHVFPQKNLVKYLGFGESATHTKVIDNQNRLFYSTQKYEEIDFPLKHPDIIEANFRIDYMQMMDIYNVKRECRLLSRDELFRIKSASRVLIYGAGKICRDLICVLANEGINKFDIAVSRVEREDQYLLGNKVHEIKEYREFNLDSIVLLAARKTYHREMESVLRKMGFDNYIVI